MIAGIGSRIAFRVDASERMGGGHVMRCLTLAAALARHGAKSTFISAALPAVFGARVREAGHRLVEIDAGSTRVSEGPDWDSTAMPAEDQHKDAADTHRALSGKRYDWLVIDHYRLDHVWEMAVQGLAEKVLILDDLANRRHVCDAVLDHSFGRLAKDYEGLTPRGCTLLAGGRHLLLRSEFAAMRLKALQRRTTDITLARLLISLGATDLNGVTARVLRSVVDAGITEPIDVVLSRGASSLAEVERLAADRGGISLHIDVRTMATLMTAADVAVGAGGMTTWERCCLGLPSTIVVLADNQRSSAEALAALGAADVVDDADQVGIVAGQLLRDVERRRRMAAASSQIVDGRGADRVAAFMLRL